MPKYGTKTVHPDQVEPEITKFKIEDKKIIRQKPQNS